MPRPVLAPAGGLFLAPRGGLLAFSPPPPVVHEEFGDEFTDEFQRLPPAVQQPVTDGFTSEYSAEYQRVGQVVQPPPDPVPEPTPVSDGFTSEYSAEYQRVAVTTPVEPPPPDPGTGVLLFSTTLENADTVPTWANQELSVGQFFKPGDVPSGSAARCLVDGNPIPTQLSNRVFWNDGSLKWAQVRLVVPAPIPVGGTKTITWQRYTGTWASHDAALHTSTAAITSKVALTYRFTSFKGRTAAQVLTAERGPKSFASADMLASANAAWTETVMAGPVVTEWRATDMAKLPNGTKDDHLGCLLYARAWGGTANNPRRIEFVFRSMYGWSDGVPSDQMGLRCSMDLLVGSTVVRGSSLTTPTPGWRDRDSYNGGFYASAGPTGKADWYDVATNSFVTPPKLVYRINVMHGISTRFLPPYDTNNTAYAAPTTLDYVPQGTGTLRQEQDDVGTYVDMGWTTSEPFAACMVAHARRPVAEVVAQAQNRRVTAWGIAALGSVGFNRTTRKLICHLPPAKNPDPTALGASVWNGTKPQTVPNGSGGTGINKYIWNQDVPHLPQVTWWTALTEGDQHILDLAYAEATLPGLHAGPTSGFYVPEIPNPGGTPVSAGGIYFQGQVRGVGHAARPILNAMAIGHPADPHHKLVKALWANYIEAREAHIRDQDYWRDTSQPNDGRYFRDLKMYPMTAGNQEPQYKVWMHTFSLQSTTYGYAITEDPEARRLAEWWAHIPTVLGGGWHNDANYLMKPDPANAGAYYHLCNNHGTGGTNTDRRPWPNIGQFKSDGPAACTYRADNQTVTFPSAAVNGQVVTITGVHQTGEPITMTDVTKIPGGLVRGIPYYVVQASGNNGKLSLSSVPGAAPVTFDARGADIVGQCARNNVFGVAGHGMKAGSTLSIDHDSYHVQILAALDMYQHYVAPTDARVRLARQKMKALKTARGGSYALRGLTTVPP